MRAHQLGANGEIINTIIVDSLDMLPGLVDAAIGGEIGDSIVGGVMHKLTERLPPVPESVSRRQARQALLLRGMLPNVQTVISAVPDETQRGLAQIYWDDSQEFIRAHPLIVSLGAALGLDSAALDDLFRFASGL